MTITLEETALFLQSELLLHRAAEALTFRLKQQDPYHPGVTPAELVGMFAAGSVALCYDWGDRGLFVPNVDDAHRINACDAGRSTPAICTLHSLRIIGPACADITHLRARPYGSTQQEARFEIKPGPEIDEQQLDLDEHRWGKMVLPRE